MLLYIDNKFGCNKTHISLPLLQLLKSIEYANFFNELHVRTKQISIYKLHTYDNTLKIQSNGLSDGLGTTR